MKIQSLIGKLAEEKTLQHGEWVELWSNYTAADRIYAGKIARKITDEIFGRKVFLRGIVEFSNLCGNDCFYCGIRKSNTLVKRYNMSDEAILNCCSNGYKNGIRTFVLQSGEAANFDLERITALVRRIKKEFADDHWKLYGFGFYMNGDSVVVDFGSKKRMKFAIVDFDEGEQDMPFDKVFESISAQYTANDTQWSEKYKTASDTIETMNNELLSREYPSVPDKHLKGIYLP